MTTPQIPGPLLITAVLLYALIGAGIWWRAEQVQVEGAAIDALLAEIQQAEQEVALLPALEKEVRGLRAELADAVRILPAKQELNDFVRTVSQFAQEAGVKLLIFQPTDAAMTGAFSRHEYKLELTATLWQFLAFMNLFENHKRFISIREFALSARRATPPGAQDQIHRMSLVLESYAYTGSLEHAASAGTGTAKPAEAAGYTFLGARGRRDVFVDPRQ